MILIHNICIAFNGLGNFNKVEIVINEIAAMLLQIKMVTITITRNI